VLKDAQEIKNGERVFGGIDEDEDGTRGIQMAVAMNKSRGMERIKRRWREQE